MRDKFFPSMKRLNTGMWGITRGNEAQINVGRDGPHEKRRHERNSALVAPLTISQIRK